MSSSISNSSDSKQEKEQASTVKAAGSNWRQRACLGFIGLLLILAALDWGVFRNLDFYGRSPGFIGQLAEVEASFAAGDPERIKVVILGDSQSQDALRPTVLAAASSYEDEEIFNFSLSGGSAYDVAYMWQVYGERMPNLEKVLIVVNEHQFNESRTAEDIKFRYLATLGQRIAVMDTDNYGELLLGWVFRSFATRSIWVPMIDKYRQDQLRTEIPAVPGGLAPITWSPSTDRTEAYAQSVADRWFEDFELGGIRQKVYAKMLDQLQARNLAVTILQLPRSVYFEQVIADDYAAQVQAYAEMLQQMSSARGMHYERMSNDGLELDVHFRDTNHLNSEGAEKISEVVAQKWLRE